MGGNRTMNADVTEDKNCKDAPSKSKDQSVEDSTNNAPSIKETTPQPNGSNSKGNLDAEDTPCNGGPICDNIDGEIECVPPPGEIVDVRVCPDVGTGGFFAEKAIAKRAETQKKRKKMLSQDAEMLGEVQDMLYGFAAMDAWPTDPLASLGGLSVREDKARIAEELLANVRPVDIKNPSTWNCVLGAASADAEAQHSLNIAGQCCLVTCICLLIQKGYAVPLMWQDVMQLASQLLAPGGFLLMYDTEKWGQFAKISAMEAFVSSKSLALEFVEKSEPIDYVDDPDGRMFTVVFRKKGKPMSGNQGKVMKTHEC